MLAWRSLGILAAFLSAASVGRAQTYTLAESIKVGDCFHLRLDMNVTGELRITRDGREVPIKLTGSAEHEFPERVLQIGANGLPAKVARAYGTARATFQRGPDKSELSLRKERQLCVAQRHKDVPLVYSPAGPLTRDELELTEHFDPLFVTGLLPAKPVAIGDTWKVPNAVAQALCSFEGMIDHDLTCKLVEVKDNVARVSVAGAANGIDLGAPVKLEIDGVCYFSLTTNRLMRLEWKQKDERGMGPANPASTMQSTVVLVRAAANQPSALADVALVNVPDGFEPPQSLTNLWYRDPRGRFDLTYDRQWCVVAETKDHVVLRLLDRGDFVAQATLTPWDSAPPGKHLSAAEFKEAMNGTPGWEPEKELQAGEVPTGTGGPWMYRLSALGQMDGTAVLQNFYLIASPSGEQMVAVFTMTPKLADKLGSRDLSLAGSIELPKK